jgi:hypothetical protein
MKTLKKHDMRALTQTLKALATLVVILSSTIVIMAQTDDSPTQQVCPGVEPYRVTPDNVGNTFLWTITPGTSGVEWTIGSPTASSTDITWTNAASSQTFTVTFKEVTASTNCWDEKVLTVTVNPMPVVPIAANQTECAQNPLQTLTATATTTDGSTVVWYDAPTGGNIVATPTLNTVSSVTYYAQSELGTCTSLTRTPVVLTINQAPEAPIAANQTECAKDPLQTLTATATTTDGSTVVWYDAPTGGNIVASPTLNTVNTVTYYAQSELGTCTSLTRTPVVLTIEPTTPPTISGASPVCSTTTGNVYTTEAGMANYVWVVSSGGTITSGGLATDSSVTVTWITAGPQSVSVNYESTNGCSASIPVVLPVTVDPLPATSPIFHN